MAIRGSIEVVSRLSSAPLLFGASALLLVGLLFGGLWYAGKYNDDQAHATEIAQNDNHATSSQVLPETEHKSTPPADTKPKTTTPAPKKSASAPSQPETKQVTPAPKSTPTPTQAPTTPKTSPSPVVATTGASSIPTTGANVSELAVTSALIMLSVFLGARVRTQRHQLRALR